MKKVRRFGDGGETIDMVAPESEETAKARLGRDSSAPEPEEPNIVFAAPGRFSGPAAKSPVVTKEQLQAFKAEYGADKDLTDYMNKQQGGLKRRNAPLPSAPAAAPKAEAKKTDTSVERGLPAMSVKERSAAIDQIPLDDKRTPVKGESASGSELGRNISNTLSALPISRGIQAAQSGAKLAGRKAVEEFVKKDPTFREKELEIIKDIPKLLGGPKKQLALPAPPSKLALPAPPSRLALPAPPRGASAAESTKAKLAGELRRGAQPTKFTSPSKSTASKKTRKFNEDEGGVEFRRGGSVSSASKRADGCAIRGKTRA